MRLLFSAMIACHCTAIAHPAGAQAYPSRPVRMVIAFAPGGIADTIGRLVGQKLNDGFGQPIIGDNRPGAGGALAARLVAGATPDGHTLLVTTTAITVNATAVKDAVDPRTQLSRLHRGYGTDHLRGHRSVRRGRSWIREPDEERPLQLRYCGSGHTEHLNVRVHFTAIPGWSRRIFRIRRRSTGTAVVAQQVDMSTTTIPTLPSQPGRGWGHGGSQPQAHRGAPEVPTRPRRALPISRTHRGSLLRAAKSPPGRYAH